MRNLSFSKVLLGFLLVLAGLPRMVVAAGQQDKLTISNGGTVWEDLNVGELTIEAASTGPIEIGLAGASSIESITVKAGTNAEILLMGDKEKKSVWGVVTVEKGACLTIGRLGNSPKQLTVATVTNHGELVDETGAVQKVAGAAGFEIKAADAYSRMGELFIHSEAEGDLGLFPTACLQKWGESSWKQVGDEKNGSNISLSVSESGTYRLKWVCDNEEGVRTELYSKDIKLLKIEGDKDLKDSIYNAIAFHCNTLDVKQVSMDNVKVSPCTTEEGAAGLSVALNSYLELTLKGGNSNLGVLRNYGTMTLKREGNAQLDETTIYNEGVFTDESGTTEEILGPAGLWIEKMEFKEDVTAPDGTIIKGVNCVWHNNAFKGEAKATMEKFENGEWIDYWVTTPVEEKNDASSYSLRSSRSDWSAHQQSSFATAIAGTYRIKFQVTKDKSITTIYSESFNLVATSIDDDNTSLGEEAEQTVIPALDITAKGTDGKPATATLYNVSIGESAVAAPSLTVRDNANVELSLQGDNNLGNVRVNGGSKIVLKPGDKMKDLSISSVRNGGIFVDETGTTARVEDLSGNVMIEFTDTIIYQIGNAVSVSLRAVGNSLTGGYLLLGDHEIEKLNTGNQSWERYNSNKSLMRADESVDNPNKSAETLVNLTTTDEGTYRMKVISESIDNDDHNATLYFMFKITNLEDEITIRTINGTSPSIDGTDTKYTDANMLIFSTTESSVTPVEVTLTDVQLKQQEGYEEYTSSIIAKDQNYELTLNGNNDLAAFVVEEGATATLKKGDTFESLNATVYNAGKFTDETGTIQKVVDANGLTMVSIAGYEMPAWNGYIVNVNFDFYFGNYEVIEQDDALEYLVDGDWKPYHNGVLRLADGTPEGGDPESGVQAYTYTGLKEGQYRVKIYAEEWETAVPEGSEENAHTVTLYHYFTINEPTPEPTYYSITLPTVEGATTSPAAGTYSEEEGSYFRFSLTLDPDYDQSKPEVKANGKVLTPDANGFYTIDGISEDITITITGVVENTPTGNAEVEENGVKIWTADGRLHLSIPTAERVLIYGFNGGLTHSMDEVAGDISVDLSKGSYIIVVGEKRYKVAL